MSLVAKEDIPFILIVMGLILQEEEIKRLQALNGDKETSNNHLLKMTFVISRELALAKLEHETLSRKFMPFSNGKLNVKEKTKPGSQLKLLHFFVG